MRDLWCQTRVHVSTSRDQDPHHLHAVMSSSNRQQAEHQSVPRGQKLTPRVACVRHATGSWHTRTRVTKTETGMRQACLVQG